MQFDPRSVGSVGDGEEQLSKNLRSREKGTPHNNTQNLVLADLLYTEVTILQSALCLFLDRIVSDAVHFFPFKN